MPAWLFTFVAVLAVLGALGVILQRNPVHSLLALVLVLSLIAVLFIALGAVALGFLQAIVYVGAIMVLFLFVIWLLNLETEPREGGRLLVKLAAAVLAAMLAAELAALAWRAAPGGAAAAGALHQGANYGSMAALAKVLMGEYLLAFEVTSVLLLAAVVGAVALARKDSGAGPQSSTPGRLEPPLR